MTLEDILEEIVGEVSDPFDKFTPEIEALEDGSYRIGGLCLMEDVNHALDLDLHDPAYDTIAGYTLGKMGRIPKVNDKIDCEGVHNPGRGYGWHADRPPEIKAER